MEMKSFSPDNQLCITCPIFGATTKIAACFMLRDQVWRGDRPDVRRGCQVALHANKCPINHIVKRMGANGVDDYHSSTPVVRSVEQDILDRIGSVLISAKDIDKAELTAREREILLEANERAIAGKIIKKVKKSRARRAPPSDGSSHDTAPVITAAATGDLASAINATPSAEGATK